MQHNAGEALWKPAEAKYGIAEVDIVFEIECTNDTDRDID